MVKSIKSKSSKRGNKKSSKQMKKQKGGGSNSCVLPYASGNINYRGSSSISGADAHNLNPQASFDLLDNKTMLYGEVVPLGQTGGNRSNFDSCGDEGGHTNNMKTTTFKKYLQNLDEKFSLNGGGTCGSNNIKKKK